ncbi:uncharacterized protein JCM15063_004277 [Sporobolomyces koalae]|uniref:uncharacterized protein n=1 Tax=Sporobolomyces koalae TaxID=500713 RepID=UPI00317498B7
MSAAALLSLYVTVDTTRALLVFGALHSGVELSPSALTFGSEILKLTVAIGGVVYYGGSRFLLSSKTANESWFNYSKPYLRFAIPAALYGTNNVLYLTGLKITSPALLHVCVLSKLPLTALLHHIVIKKRRSRPMWISLAVLTTGLIVAGSPEALWDPSQRGSIRFSDMISGPVIGLTVGVTYLYFWGMAFAGFAAIVSSWRSPAMESSSTIASLPAFSLVAIVTAATGLVVALILRQKDNLVKLVGSSLCITTVFVLQHLFFPVTDGLDFRTTFGIGILTLATWTYNHYKGIGDDSSRSATEPVRDYVELSTSDDSSPLMNSKDGLPASSQVPDTPSSSFSTTTPVMPLASSSTPDLYTPTPTRLAIGIAFVLVIASLASLQNNVSTDKRTLRDVKDFFTDKRLAAASWTRAGENEDLDCVVRTRQTLVDEKDWQTDPDAVLANSGCHIYPLPDDGLATHLFWSGKWRTPTFSLATDSWLATQPSVNNNRLIWWYEAPNPPPESFVSHYTSPTSPYRSIVKFEQFNESMSEGTCLHDMKEWKDLEYRREVEMPSMTRKDLIKLLLLNKYGGIWLDPDVIVLKDLKEVVRTGPSIIVENEFVDNAIMVAGPSWGSAGTKMLETACELPFGTNEIMQKFPGLRLKAGPAALYSEGVSRLCTQEGCGLSSLPRDWLLAPSTLSPCQPHAPLATTELTTSYMWSAQMLARIDEDPCWDENEETLITRIRKRIDEVLKAKIDPEQGVLHNLGGNLFPRDRILEPASEDSVA